MSRGAGLWPGGRERSVPPGFPGEKDDEPGPDGRAPVPRGYRARRYLDEETVEEARPEPPRAPSAARRDEDDLGRRYARDDERDDRPPPRRLSQIGEPPPDRRPPGAGVWREPRRLRPAEEVEVEEFVEEVVPASRWERDVPPPRSPERGPERELEPREVEPVAPAEPRRPEVVADAPAAVVEIDDDDDEDDRRRPPSWYRRGDDDAAPHTHPRPRLVPALEPEREPEVASIRRPRPEPEIEADQPSRPRWEPRPLPDAERRPARRRDGPPPKRLVAAADARVQPAVAASRRSHPTGRPATAAGPRRLASRWPGSHAGALPPDFPGGNGGFERPRPRALAAVDPPRSRKTKGPKSKSKAQSQDIRLDPSAADPTGSAEVPEKDGSRRPLPLRPPQRLNNIVGAVYAALADPLAADSAEAREQRAAKVREIGLVAASSALVAVLVYGIFPVRTFLNQRAATDEAQERLEKIAEANEQMRREADRLRDDDDIELRARNDYGWVFPGEESYGVMPAPVAEPVPDATVPDGTTTTTTTPEG